MSLRYPSIREMVRAQFAPRMDSTEPKLTIGLANADRTPLPDEHYAALIGAERGPVQGYRRRKADPKAKARRKQVKASRRRNRAK